MTTNTYTFKIEGLTAEQVQIFKMLAGTIRQDHSKATATPTPSPKISAPKATPKAVKATPKPVKTEHKFSFAIGVNPQYQSVEVKFTEKPDAKVISALKKIHMLWNPARKVWYSKFVSVEQVKSALASC